VGTVAIKTLRPVGHGGGGLTYENSDHIEWGSIRLRPSYIDRPSLENASETGDIGVGK